MPTQSGAQPFPKPPKPVFPVEIVPPNRGFGSGGGGIGGGQGFSNFSGQFLKLMTEAGERLGKAAAEEIAKVQLTINGGTGGGFSNSPDGKPRARPVPGIDTALAQFARAAGIPGASFLGLAGPVALGVLAAKVINAPKGAESTLDAQRRFGRISPSIASAFAQSDARDLLRDMKIGEEIAPNLRKLLDERARFRDRVGGPLEVQWEKLKDGFYEGVLRMITDVAEETGLVKKLGGKPLTGSGINPWIERMDRFAGRQEQKQIVDAQLQKNIDRFKNHQYGPVPPEAADPATKFINKFPEDPLGAIGEWQFGGH